MFSFTFFILFKSYFKRKRKDITVSSQEYKHLNTMPYVQKYTYYNTTSPLYTC